MYGAFFTFLGSGRWPLLIGSSSTFSWNNTKKDKFFSRHVWGTCDHSMWFETTVDCDAPSAPLHITLMIHSPFVPENFVELLHMFQNCLVQIWIFYDLVIFNTVSLTAFQIDIEEIGIWQSFLLDLYSSICCICWKLVVVKRLYAFESPSKESEFISTSPLTSTR